MKTINTTRLYFRMLLAVLITLMFFAGEAEAQRNNNRGQRTSATDQTRTSSTDRSVASSRTRHAAGLETIPQAVRPAPVSQTVVARDAYAWAHTQQGYASGWSRFVYKQFVAFDGNRRRAGELEIRTYLKRKVDLRRGRLDKVKFEIERVVLVENGRIVGEVRHIPSRFKKVTASTDRRGRLFFEKMTYLTGDPYFGFEMLTFRASNRYGLRDGLRQRDVRVGVLDLRRERVREVRRSQFVDGFGSSRNMGLVPLLPENERWGLDFAVRRFDSGRHGSIHRMQGLQTGIGNVANWLGPIRNNQRGLLNGAYRFEDNLDFDGDDGSPVRMRRRIELEELR